VAHTEELQMGIKPLSTGAATVIGGRIQAKLGRTGTVIQHSIAEA
jgi:hypothetical protein